MSNTDKDIAKELDRLKKEKLQYLAEINKFRIEITQLKGNLDAAMRKNADYEKKIRELETDVKNNAKKLIQLDQIKIRVDSLEVDLVQSISGLEKIKKTFEVFKKNVKDSS